jgi:hypothetical protein
MPAEYRTSILKESSATYPDVETDELCLAQIKDYRSLIPASQASMKPIFQLGPKEGIWGQNETAVEQCGRDFGQLAQALITRTKVKRTAGPSTVSREAVSRIDRLKVTKHFSIQRHQQAQR